MERFVTLAVGGAMLHLDLLSCLICTALTVAGRCSLFV
jgi:hypothetical protein